MVASFENALITVTSPILMEALVVSRCSVFQFFSFSSLSLCFQFFILIFVRKQVYLWSKFLTAKCVFKILLDITNILFICFTYFNFPEVELTFIKMHIFKVYNLIGFDILIDPGSDHCN